MNRADLEAADKLINDSTVGSKATTFTERQFIDVADDNRYAECLGC
ncbi:MAG: hypothetical protein WKF84_23235 [Pyrinomonadaceae bacterium]